MHVRNPEKHVILSHMTSIVRSYAVAIKSTYNIYIATEESILRFPTYIATAICIYRS